MNAPRPADAPSSPLPHAPGYAADGVLALSALEQAARIRARELSSRELVSAYLDRIQAHNPALRAFVDLQAASALRQADRADRALRRGDAQGPFHGVPTAMKDHHMIRGTRTRIGSRAFRHLWSPIDDGTVRRMRRAGFVLVGKTAMSELGILPVVETEIQPPTRNPWDATRTAGGSSGGAGAALAAGLLPVAPGSDGAGSVRIPAALNGLVGLKPTRGLVPDDAPGVNVYGLATLGPLARTVDDAAALLDVLSGPSSRPALAASRERVPSLRIGLLVEGPFGDVDPRIAARTEEAARRLEAAGHTVEVRTMPRVGVDAFLPLYQRMVSRIPVPHAAALGPFARWFWESGRGVNDADAWERHHYFQRLGLELMEGLDLIVTPTIGRVAPPVGTWAGLEPEAQFMGAAELGMFTALCNVTGQPAITVPAGRVDGLPIGVQIAGRPGDDARLLALARLLLEGGLAEFDCDAIDRASRGA